MAIETQESPLTVLHEEAISSMSASQKIFANCPDGCEVIYLSVGAQDIRVKFLGRGFTSKAGTVGAAASSTVGQLYKVNTGAPYKLYMMKSDALKVEAIEATASANVYISYMGRASH